MHARPDPPGRAARAPPARARVYLPLARMPELPGADPAPLRALDVRRRDLKLMAFHPLGTARADADPAHGVVDGDLQLHGVEASTSPTAASSRARSASTRS